MSERKKLPSINEARIPNETGVGPFFQLISVCCIEWLNLYNIHQIIFSVKREAQSQK